jgi:queuine tRNA-ribosyltransferase
VAETGAETILGNTYHLMLRPTAERIHKLNGGLHGFMNWNKLILTDSGGFQVMSLGALRKVTEEGVTFRSHIDGSAHKLTPERAVEIQKLLNSDIQMQLDECIRLPASVEEMQRAMELSLRWAERAKLAFGTPKDRALFGIVQGGDNRDLRLRSAQGLADIGFDGYALGGLAVGEPQEVMLSVLRNAVPALPVDRPHYLMGVGTPDDLIKAIACGIDMFDCVMPTRAGRHGLAFTRFGKINVKNARFIEDTAPLDEQMACAASSQYSRAYLNHLFKANEMLGAMLLSWHNIAYYQDLMRGAREAIEQGQYADYMANCIEGWQRGLDR